MIQQRLVRCPQILHSSLRATTDHASAYGQLTVSCHSLPQAASCERYLENADTIAAAVAVLACSL